MSRAQMHGVSFSPGLGELFCDMFLKITVLLCCGMAKNFDLQVTAREEFPLDALWVVTR
jgi:hypothetical protein